MGNAGIDYSGIVGARDSINRDSLTGIRYGVISQNHVLQSWEGSSEAIYPDLQCDNCSALIPDGAEACPNCFTAVDSDAYDWLEPIGFQLDDGEYKAVCDETGDIFVLKSPFYTRGTHCSPCAPGAVTITSPCPDGPKAYCFAPDWFDPDLGSPCLYPVYRVSDGVCVYLPPESKGVELSKILANR